MLQFIASSGFWSIGILGFGLTGLVCLLMSLKGSNRLRTLGLHLTGVCLLLGIGATCVGLWKHYPVVAKAAADIRVSRLAALIGITASSTGLAALITATNLFLYSISSWLQSKSE